MFGLVAHADVMDAHDEPFANQTAMRARVVEPLRHFVVGISKVNACDVETLDVMTLERHWMEVFHGTRDDWGCDDVGANVRYHHSGLKPQGRSECGQHRHCYRQKA